MIGRRRQGWVLAVALAGAWGASPLPAQAAAEALARNPAGELARRVANPLATLVSIPIQYNVDHGIGPFDVSRSTLNVQPVVPVELGSNARWKLISRTVVPVIHQEAGPVGDDISGLGDITQSAFFTPNSPLGGGWMIGAGPVFQIPTGSCPELTNGRWSVGPTAVVVRQGGAWTMGVLANHLWSVAGGDAGDGVSTTFAQPFVNYVTRTHTTLAINTEANRDWKAGTWSVPIHAIVTQLFRVGRQPMSAFGGVRYWAAQAEGGPEGWALRAGATLLFPLQRPTNGPRAS